MDIDWTIVAFEALNFGVLVVLLRRFLFAPVQRALVERREAIEHDRNELQQREATAEALKQEYEARLQEVEQHARARLEESTTRAQAEAETLVRQGRDEARRLIAGAEQQGEQARRRALEQLRLEVIALASEAANRVVRTMEAPAIAEAYARRAAHGLAEALAGGPPPPVISAATGEDADPDQIERLLRSILGAQVELQLSVDPQIVAGVRLRARGYEVEASASASLNEWYEQRLAQAAPNPMAETAA